MIASSLVDALADLEPGAPLDAAAERLLSTLDPADAAAAIAVLLARTDPDARERKALGAIVRALRDGAVPEPQKQAIRISARALGHSEVLVLFVEGEALLVRDPDAPTPPRPPGESDLAGTLGHRMQAARSERRPERLLRLCTDPHPSVIRNLLQNPRITESHAVRVASRRPTDAAILDEVARSARFQARPAVRRAIVQNPYATPALAASLLATLGNAVLVEVMNAPTLHEAVRDAARTLLAARGLLQ